MKIVKIYETEIYHPEGISFKIISVPTKLNSNNPQKLSQILEILNLKEYEEVKPGFLVRAIATILAAKDIKDLENWKSIRSILHNKFEKKPYYYELAEYATMANIIPFESSPLSGESLGNLVNIAGYGIGAYVGIVTAGSTPLLFITVPLGMIICGAAAGVARALEEGLKNKILKLLQK